MLPKQPSGKREVLLFVVQSSFHPRGLALRWQLVCISVHRCLRAVTDSKSLLFESTCQLYGVARTSFVWNKCFS